MSTQMNFENNQSEYTNSQGKVKVTDLLYRLKEEKKLKIKETLL